jgi:hypothetical protein
LQLLEVHAMLARRGCRMSPPSAAVTKGTGMGDGMNRPDREYMGDEFVQAWLEKQVVTRTDDYLARLRTIVGIFVVGATAVIGFFGYRVFELGTDLQAKVEQASKDAAAASSNIATSRSLLEEARRISDSTFAQVKSTVDLTTSNVEQSSSTVSSLRSTLNSLNDQQRQISAAQTNLETQANVFKSQQDDMTRSFGRQRTEFESLVDGAKDSVGSTKQAEAEVKAIAGDLKQVQELYTQVLERRQVEYAFLRASDLRDLEFYSIVKSGNEAAIKRVQIRVAVKEIKDRINLTIEVLDDGNGRRLPPQTMNQLSRSDSGPISGTPYSYRVEFVYHAKLAIDFLVVKVQPAGRDQLGRLAIG